MDKKYLLPVAFAEVLRRHRLIKRMSQKELAKSIGASRSYIVKLEKASANPSVEMMLRICKGLEIDMERFGKDLQATHHNASNLLEKCLAASGPEALRLFILSNTNPHRKP